MGKPRDKEKEKLGSKRTKEFFLSFLNKSGSMKGKKVESC
jgi:hypothetical protein